MMSQSVLEVKNLMKTFGSFPAVKGISFTVSKGQAVGLLGPNGAGKTTTIHMLLGITSPTHGSIHYFGKNFITHRQASLQRINYASSYNTLQGRITVWENLWVNALLYQVANPRQKIEELAEAFEIKKLLPRLYKDLSAGQETRVNLVKAFLNEPEILLLDEPTASLDPDIADKVLQLIEHLKETKGVSLLFTSHNMNEVTRLCDEVIFIDQGSIVAQDTPANLTKNIGPVKLRLIVTKPQQAKEVLVKSNYFFQWLSENQVEVRLEEENIAELISQLVSQGVHISDVEVEKPTLEDVFLQLARKEEHVD